jgi:hypothetical protein
MALPRLDQYQLSLQHPTLAFADPELRLATVRTDPLGLPWPISGGFALTYQLRNNGRRWAVRCFHREAADLADRYEAIQRTLNNLNDECFITVEYQTQGIRVDGAWYPITKMSWVEAVSLNQFIDSHLHPAALASLRTQVEQLAERLERYGIAHGDLQHGNMLVDRTGRLKLVDYDGMFVPSLAGWASNEFGHVNYQHPQRANQFDANLDRFSILAIDVALRALAEKPELWNRYNTGDNLLFSQTDFVNPQSSTLFSDLCSIAALRPLAEKLSNVCTASYRTIPKLQDFLTGSFRLSSATRQVPLKVRRQFDIVSSDDVAALTRRQGDVLTVVGKLEHTHRGMTRYGQPYVFLNFGNYRAGCFTVVLWSEALDRLQQAGKRIGDYQGSWVSVTGLLTVYQSRSTYRSGARVPQPQILINMPGDIRRLTEDEARVVLGGETGPARIHEADTQSPVSTPRRSPTAARRSSSTSPRSPTSDPHEAEILNRLYRPMPTSSPPAAPPRAVPTATSRPAQPRAGSSVGPSISGTHPRPSSKSSTGPQTQWWKAPLATENTLYTSASTPQPHRAGDHRRVIALIIVLLLLALVLLLLLA